MSFLRRVGSRIFRGRVVATVVVVVPLSAIGSCQVHDNLLASNFERVATGTQRKDVTDLLGAPRSVQDCRVPGEFTQRHRPDCVEVYLYPSWGVPLLPSVWVVWFDSQGKVIDKYNFVSW
jgi:hypothetical protein